MKKIVKRLGQKLGFDIRRHEPSPHDKEPVSLQTSLIRRGTVLLSYIIQPFLLKPGEPISNAHTHDWESFQIARTFLHLGYDVDVIDYRNKDFVPSKKYAFFVSARTNFERIARMLNKDCVKIAHLDTANWVFNNGSSYKRLLDLQKRKGATIPLSSLRQIESNLAIEHADYATLLGNEFTLGTYQYAKKPIFLIPISTCGLYPSPEKKDFASCRRNFLWLGSGGLVHKGLDLVLDIFAKMKECHLYVCGPIQQERNFQQLYHRELYETPNIHTIGWLDVNGSEFTDITNTCIALIYPSSSEGQCGSVVNCLHAGLIPIISYESGVNVGDFGVILENCSIEAIRKAVTDISNSSPEKLGSMSQKAWEYARTHHTRQNFAEAYRNVIEQVFLQESLWSR
jgi:glycosyltransferase involved in cell wall biosynthesis